jgi:hypothetical protein
MEAPEPASTISNLADVTPGLNRRVSTRPVRLPASGLQLSVQGTGVTAQTDANGAFMLTGVPAAQPLTVVAQVQTGPALVVSGPGLSLNPGQTMDLGMLSTAGCADPAAPFTLQPQPISPPAATDDATTQAPDASTVAADSATPDTTGADAGSSE